MRTLPAGLWVSLSIVAVVLLVALAFKLLQPPTSMRTLTMGVDPLGRKIFFAFGNRDGSSSLVQWDRAAQTWTELVHRPEGLIRWPSLSADRSRLAYSLVSGTSASAIHILELASRKTIALDGPRLSILPTFTPSGQLLFASAARRRPYSFGGQMNTDYTLWSYDPAQRSSKEVSDEVFTQISSIAADRDGYWFVGEALNSNRFSLFHLPTPSSRVVQSIPDATSVVCYPSGRLVTGPTPEADSDYDIFSVSDGRLTRLTHLAAYLESLCADAQGTAYVLVDEARNFDYALYSVSDGAPQQILSSDDLRRSLEKAVPRNR